MTVTMETDSEPAVTCAGWVECTEYFVRGGGVVMRKRGVGGGRHVALVSHCYLVDRQIQNIPIENVYTPLKFMLKKVSRIVYYIGARFFFLRTWFS